MLQDKTGKSLEKLVGHIQQLMDPGCTVTYREKIPNRLGILREFDVVFRGFFGGHPALGVIECKDWSDKVGTPEIDAFITKSRDINADMRIIVSPKGFTSTALSQAKDAGVGVYSLLPEDADVAGFSIGVLWYAHSYFWTNMTVDFKFSGIAPELGSYTGTEILYRGRPVTNWLLKELSTTYCNLETVKSLTLRVQFLSHLKIVIKNKSYKLSEMTLRADRTYQRKKRFMQITGEAFFDWKTNELRVPHRGKVSVHGFDSNLQDWEDYDGEIPPTGPYQFIVSRYWGCLDLDTAKIPRFSNFEIHCNQVE